MYTYDWDHFASGCLEFLSDNDKIIISYGMVPLKFLSFLTDQVIKHMCKMQRCEAIARITSGEPLEFDNMIIDTSIVDLMTFVSSDIVNDVRLKLSRSILKAATNTGLLIA